MRYNKDQIKSNLDIDEVFSLVEEFDGDPQMKGNYFIARTICHNPTGEGSYKLYYYEETHLFHCYTGCENPSFDIFELVQKVMRLRGKEYGLYDAIKYVASYFHLSEEENDEDFFETSIPDWDIFERYSEIPQIQKNNKLQAFDEKIIRYLPFVRIPSWEAEGISNKALAAHNIRYDPVYNGIIIPHYDIDNYLIGVRIRTLIKEQEEFGKYRPAILNRVMYNHPLGFNLYNLNRSKYNITAIEKAIVFESEKSTLQYMSYFGAANDISVACCGSSLSSYQVDLLKSCGAAEIIIAFDRQFQKHGDDEWKQWTKKLTAIHEKYGGEVQISFVFDKENLLDYKDSPTDKGKEIFLQLFKERIYL